MEEVQTKIDADENAPEWVSPEVAAAAAGEQADFSKNVAPPEANDTDTDS